MGSERMFDTGAPAPFDELPCEQSQRMLEEMAADITRSLGRVSSNYREGRIPDVLVAAA